MAAFIALHKAVKLPTLIALSRNLLLPLRDTILFPSEFKPDGYVPTTDIPLRRCPPCSDGTNCPPHSRDGFEIAIICALPVERDPVEALLDEEYERDGFSYGKAPRDRNVYTKGWQGYQDMMLVYMTRMGTISAAAVAANLCSSFEGIKVGTVVGICGGVPTTAGGGEILRGDVIIST